jgi:hypothetical protein
VIGYSGRGNVWHFFLRSHGCLQPERPNQAMKPTQHLVNALDLMHALDFKVLGGLPQLLFQNSWAQASL